MIHQITVLLSKEQRRMQICNVRRHGVGHVGGGPVGPGKLLSLQLASGRCQWLFWGSVLSVPCKCCMKGEEGWLPLLCAFVQWGFQLELPRSLCVQIGRPAHMLDV